jgi:hypothetical protein
MFALLCFILAVLASPFKSKIRLEAENVALRHQLIVLRRKVQGRVRPTKRPLVFYLSASLLGQLPQETSTTVQSTALGPLKRLLELDGFVCQTGVAVQGTAVPLLVKRNGRQVAVGMQSGQSRRDRRSRFHWSRFVALLKRHPLPRGGLAHAQGKLDAAYVVTLAGVPIGKGAWSIDIQEDQYTATASGATSGLLRVFAAVRATARRTAHGTVSGGQPLASTARHGALACPDRRHTAEVPYRLDPDADWSGHFAGEPIRLHSAPAAANRDQHQDAMMRANQDSRFR